MALFTALAALFQAAETLLPLPLPWLRLGMGNAFVLSALLLWGFRAGAFVSLGKVFLGGLMAGKLLSPGFFLALGGSLAALLIMSVAALLPLGFVGISAAGALASGAAQLVVARYLVLGTDMVWSLAPVVGGVSLAAGAATGVLAAWVCRTVEEKDAG